MKTVHKHSVALEDLSEVLRLYVPEDAVIFSVENQYEQLTFWYLTSCDEDGNELMEQTRVECYVMETGRLIDTEHSNVVSANFGKFMGTVLFRGGSYVLHVFEKKKE